MVVDAARARVTTRSSVVVADSPRRIIDDAAQGDLVARVEGQAQVGDEVFYFLALEELLAAVHHVGNAGGAQLSSSTRLCTLERYSTAILGVAVILFQQIFDLHGHELGLAFGVGGHHVIDGFAGFALRPQNFAVALLVVGDDRVGGGQNRRRGAVVLLQLDHFGAGKRPLEGEDVLGLGAAPAVDGLIVIPHDAEVAMRRSIRLLHQKTVASRFVS